ncbi:MAG TPA: MBL fold metallo-hydrolase [Candidatus Saccharimonadales bacterium]
MFDIEYKGAGSVLITTKKTKLITDPKLSLVGLKDQPTKGMIEIATEARFATRSDEAHLNIEGPGEYEVGDFSIKGVAAVRHLDSGSDQKLSTIYRIEVGDVRLVLIGDVAPNLSEDQLESIGVVDMVIIPVGGNGYTLDATSAAHMVRAIDAKIVVPIHYADNGVKYEVPQDPLELFAKEFGGEIEQTSKLKVKSAGSLPQVPTIIELTRS